jgi:uncharacterized protein YcnI
MRKINALLASLALAASLFLVGAPAHAATPKKCNSHALGTARVCMEIHLAKVPGGSMLKRVTLTCGPKYAFNKKPAVKGYRLDFYRPNTNKLWSPRNSNIPQSTCERTWFPNKYLRGHYVTGFYKYKARLRLYPDAHDDIIMTVRRS